MNLADRMADMLMCLNFSPQEIRDYFTTKKGKEKEEAKCFIKCWDVPESWFRSRAFCTWRTPGYMGILSRMPFSTIHPSSGNESRTIRSAWAFLFQPKQFKTLRSPTFSKAKQPLLSFHSYSWMTPHPRFPSPRTLSALHLSVLKTLPSPHFPPSGLPPQVKDQHLWDMLHSIPNFPSQKYFNTCKSLQ